MRALLASGDPPFANALVSALASVTDAPDIEHAPSPDTLPDVAAERACDLLLVDLVGRDPADPMAFVTRARRQLPSVPIVVLVTSPEAAVDALAAGADGFAPRDPGAASTIAAVTHQTRDRFHPSPDLPKRVLYVTRHAPMHDESVTTPIAIEVATPTSGAAVPPPYDVGQLDFDAAVLDMSAGGSDLVGIAQDLVARLGEAPLFVLADATDRQLARAVLRLGARQVVARTGAWPVRLYAAIQQYTPPHWGPEDSALTPSMPVHTSSTASDSLPVAEGVPVEEHRALAAQLEAALAELDALRTDTETQLQREVSALRAAWDTAMREVESARAADARAAAGEIQALQGRLELQAGELALARETAARAERDLDAARDALREGATRAQGDAQAARAARPAAGDTAAPAGDEFPPAAADFVREVARHASEAARLQRVGLEDAPGGSQATTLQKALAAAERAQEIAQQFLDFDEHRRSRPTPVALDDLLASLLPVLTAVTGDSVRLTMAAPPDPQVRVEAPRNGVARMVAALASAAVDALPLGGTIDVEARVSDDDELGRPTARITVAARGFGRRALRAPEAVVSPLPAWSLDLRVKEGAEGTTVYELRLPAILATSESGSPAL
jgi:DNA-binding NarL/FixJ family response regulator